MTRKAKVVLASVLLLLFALVLAPGIYRRHMLRRHALMLPQDRNGEHGKALLAAGRSAVPALIGVVRSGDRFQVATAARVLGQIGDTRAVEPLVEAYCRHPHSLIVVALKALGEEPSRLVLKKLQEGNLELIPVAGEVCDETAVPTLMSLAKVSGEGKEYYQAVVTALGMVGSQAAIDTILEVHSQIKGGGRHVHQALVAIGAAGARKYVHLLESTRDERVRALMVNVVGELRLKEAIPQLVRMLKDERLSWGGRRTAALQALSKIPGNGQTELFLEIMQQLREEPRKEHYAMVAAVALSNEGDARAEPLLVKHLREHIPKHSYHVPAIYALGRCRGPGSVDFLVALLTKYAGDESAQDEGIQRYVLKALGYTNDAMAAKAVLRWIRTRAPETTLHGSSGNWHLCVPNAIWSLGELGSEDAITDLERLRDLKCYSVCGGGHDTPYRDAATLAITKIREKAEGRDAQD